MPETLVKIRYLFRFKKFPNLKNPVDLNEKILWLKLYSDTSRWTELADKYAVRKYIESLGLGEYLVKLYGKWDRVEDIEFDKLPDTVIFKINNGDGKGTNKIINNLKEANHKELRKLFNKWLTRKHIGSLSAEPQYKDIKPCIIAEEVLPIEDGAKSLVDYKIWCINGKAQYIVTYAERDLESLGAEKMVYDLDWHPHPEFCKESSEFKEGELMERPKNLKEMLDVATRLSEGFPILRVDLYNINGKIYFGELTFTSNGGMMDSFTPSFLTKLGEMADISGIRRVK